MHLGIDFGTSYTKLGYFEEGKIVNILGEGNSIPSVVSYIPIQDKLYFGDVALRLNEPNAITAQYFKLELKRNLNFRLGNYNLKSIIYKFFVYLNNTYIHPLGATIQSISISIPNYFGLNARHILLHSIRKAFNINDVYLIPEPIAALIGYNHSTNLPLSGDILSIDIGGGTSDFSFLTVAADNNQVVLETQFQAGHDAFSGSEIDRGILRNILFPAYTIQTGKVIPEEIVTEKIKNPKQSYILNRMLRTAEKLKIDFTANEEFYLNEADFYDHNSLVMFVDKNQYLNSLEKIYNRLENYLNNRVLHKARHLGLVDDNKFDFDYVLLVGGGSLASGVKELIQDTFQDVFIVIPEEPEFNVLKGLCAYKNKDYDFSNIKSIYPFNFYIESYDLENENSSLEKIPFDTKNIELDFNQSYKIISLDKTSSYNLSPYSDEVKFRIYEVEEEDESYFSQQRFSGQDIVLDFIHSKNELPDTVHIYLNFIESKLQVSHEIKLVHEDFNYFPNLIKKQKDIYKLLSEYKYTDQNLLEDFKKHIDKLEHYSEKPYSNHSTTTLFKLYAMLQLLKNNISN
ncbi:DnaK-like protein [Candidatus Syntrophocurvum alkaliphilum]|uniref:DnaK-like protein n=1 Tax=Candidatus Syntrophocurvum alkaliphilum TaxID=2293317 RepID=A0A6I6DDF3_9FIRM|nr:Hsp70 family protein [Candidatus Syntrophocurvum alkaliphilum]QGT98842.1 DnaK-like protein [Candidatus Syntrophocurvum alkaliphilum]